MIEDGSECRKAWAPYWAPECLLYRVRAAGRKRRFDISGGCLPLEGRVAFSRVSLPGSGEVLKGQGWIEVNIEYTIESSDMSQRSKVKIKFETSLILIRCRIWTRLLRNFSIAYYELAIVLHIDSLFGVWQTFTRRQRESESQLQYSPIENGMKLSWLWMEPSWLNHRSGMNRSGSDQLFGSRWTAYWLEKMRVCFGMV